MKPALMLACSLLVLTSCASRPKAPLFAAPALARMAIVSAADDDGTPLGDPPPVRQVGKRHDVLLLSGGGSLGRLVPVCWWAGAKPARARSLTW